MTPERLTCKECVEFLMDYLEQSLAPDVRATFERHLTACPNCVRYLESYKTTTTVCKKVFKPREGEAMPAVPEELIQAILAARRNL